MKRRDETPGDWRFNFEMMTQSCAKSRHWTKLTNSFVQMGVHEYNPQDEYSAFKNAEEQMYHNKCVWMILQSSNAMVKVRQILERDLMEESDLEGYGKIALKSYVEKVLTHFLHNTPNPEWVGK